MEAGELGLFLVSACAFTVLFEHPGSALHRALPNPFVRRALMGLAMGGTAVGIVFSPLGRRSGAHFNPAVTATFWSLGKVEGADAAFYVLAQFVGAIAGVGMASILFGSAVGHPAVHYAATSPGRWGIGAAFAAEAAISFLLMTVVLRVSSHARLARFTGLFAGALVALFITFEAPVSGMSMNPARTLGSAAGASVFDALWIYFLAPPLGMLAAAAVHRRFAGAASVRCAKLHHANTARCIFRCQWTPASPALVRKEKP